jgi:hypothetical protein
MFRIGDDSALAADVAKHGCRWFAFIGSVRCDECGRSIREHEGDLRTDPAADMFSGDWVGMLFTWSTLPDRLTDAEAPTALGPGGGDPSQDGRGLHRPADDDDLRVVEETNVPATYQRDWNNEFVHRIVLRVRQEQARAAKAEREAEVWTQMHNDQEDDRYAAVDDRDKWKARAEKAEAALAGVRRAIDEHLSTPAFASCSGWTEYLIAVLDKHGYGAAE